MLPIATNRPTSDFLVADLPRHKLTDAFLRNLKTPATGQVEYWDALTPGFGVRVSYGGRKAFQALTRINGKLQRFTLGSYPKLALVDARDQAERIIKDAAKGISPKEREAGGAHVRLRLPVGTPSRRWRKSSWPTTPRTSAPRMRCSA